MRARYYNPTLNHFHSRDPFSGFVKRPVSQNDYNYANGNPVKYTDPSGYVAEPAGAPGGRTCTEWHGCPELRLVPVPFEPTYKDDPRQFEIRPIFCLGGSCSPQESPIPLYLARADVAPGGTRTDRWKTTGNSLDAAGAAVDLLATGTSLSFLGIQGVSAALAGPGPDDPAVAAAYYLADQYIENPVSWIGAGLVVCGDIASGETDLTRDRLILGQDTLFLTSTAFFGQYVGLTRGIYRTDAIFNDKSCELAR